MGGRNLKDMDPRTAAASTGWVHLLAAGAARTLRTTPENLRPNGTLEVIWTAKELYYDEPPKTPMDFASVDE